MVQVQNDCGCVYRYGLGGEQIIPCGERKYKIHMDIQAARRAILLNLLNAVLRLMDSPPERPS